MAAKIALGLGVPLLASVIWGTFVAPKALLVQESAPSRLLLRLAVFGAATTTLYASDHAEMAWQLMSVCTINPVLIHVLV